MWIPPFAKQKEETIYYSGEGEFVLIIPEAYFEKKCAVIIGEYVELIGIANYTILKNGNKDLTKNIKQFNYPSIFITRPGRIEKVKGLKLTNTIEDDRYRLLYYVDNDVDEIISSYKVPEDIANVENFFRLFVQTGNIPKTLAYDELHEEFLESIDVNGSSYKISAQLFGVVVSELARDPDNINQPFRWSKVIEKDMHAYIPVAIKDIPKFISPFVSVTSENWDESIVGAVLLDGKGKSSPLEKVMMK